MFVDQNFFVNPKILLTRRFSYVWKNKFCSKIFMPCFVYLAYNKAAQRISAPYDISLRYILVRVLVLLVLVLVLVDVVFVLVVVLNVDVVV